MPGFMPGIHVFRLLKQDVDGRDRPGHDENTLTPIDRRRLREEAREDVVDQHVVLLLEARM
jgi:hypothetical protein